MYPAKQINLLFIALLSVAVMSSHRILSSFPGSLMPRHVSTKAFTTHGLLPILQKNPEDVVITFAKRTAIGRAKKGQLKDVPVDEIVQGLLTVRVVTISPSMGLTFALRLCFRGLGLTPPKSTTFVSVREGILVKSNVFYQECDYNRHLPSALATVYLSCCSIGLWDSTSRSYICCQ